MFNTRHHINLKHEAKQPAAKDCSNQTKIRSFNQKLKLRPKYLFIKDNQPKIYIRIKYYKHRTQSWLRFVGYFSRKNELSTSKEFFLSILNYNNSDHPRTLNISDLYKETKDKSLIL